MCILRRLLGLLERRKCLPKPDPGLVQLALTFRSSQGKAISEAMDRKDTVREDLLAARAEVDALKAFRREAELTLMQNGLDVPSERKS